MSGTVRQGPWGYTPVRQTALARGRRWFERTDDGVLWVRCGGGRIHQAPVPPADLTAPIPDRAVNCDRITAALDAGGMHGPEVDEALGVGTVTDHVVDGWEDGTIVPTHDDLRRLSTLTGFTVAWFFAGTLPQMSNVFLCGSGARWRDTDASYT